MSTYVQYLKVGINQAKQWYAIYIIRDTFVDKLHAVIPNKSQYRDAKEQIRYLQEYDKRACKRKSITLKKLVL